MKGFRARFNSAHALALVALMVALGGTAYALEANSVGSPQLKAGAVKPTDLASNAVTSPKVKDGAIGTNDLAAAARGARAYGLVSAAGAFSSSKNITGVSHTNGSGVYCIDPAPSIDASSAVLVATPDFSGDSTAVGTNVLAHVEWRADRSDCPSGTVEVRTFSYQGDSVDNDNGGGNLPGDDLVDLDQPFGFVIP